MKINPIQFPTRKYTVLLHLRCLNQYDCPWTKAQNTSDITGMYPFSGLR